MLLWTESCLPFLPIHMLKSLTLKVMILEMGPFEGSGFRWGHGPSGWNSSLITGRDTWRALFGPYASAEAVTWACREMQPRSRMMRNRYLLFVNSLWSFVIVAYKTKYKDHFSRIQNMKGLRDPGGAIRQCYHLNHVKETRGKICC